MDANVVFDDAYVPEAHEDSDDFDPVKQVVIRSYELEKLVAFINN
jgi:hypothetical protein